MLLLLPAYALVDGLPPLPPLADKIGMPDPATDDEGLGGADELADIAAADAGRTAAPLEGAA